MNEGFVMGLARDALMTTVLVAAPVLVVSLVVGVVVSLFQAVTQINEASLAFVPKILAVFVTLMIFGPWMLNVLLSYSQRLLIDLPSMVR